MRPTITSTQNGRVKDAVKLRQRGGRAAQGRIVIDGRRELQRAMEAGVELLEVFFCHECGGDVLSEGILSRVEAAGVALSPVSPAVFSKLAYGERAEGLVAVARTPQKSLGELELAPDVLIAVLEGVQKPGNVGAVIRSADAAGVSAVIVAEGGTDLYNPNAIRSSLGAIFSLLVCDASVHETLDWLRSSRTNIIAARVEASLDYMEAAYRGRTAIVLGSEALGLSDLWRGQDITAVSLPMCGAVDSLNLSAAAAVLFYEARRQRANHSQLCQTPDSE